MLKSPVGEGIDFLVEQLGAFVAEPGGEFVLVGADQLGAALFDREPLMAALNSADEVQDQAASEMALPGFDPSVVRSSSPFARPARAMS